MHEHPSVLQYLIYWEDVPVQDLQNSEGPVEIIDVETH